MNAYIPLVYIAHPSEEQQEQWSIANKAFHLGAENYFWFNSFWHLWFGEYIDENGYVHQIAIVKDSQNENIHARVLRFLRAFKAYAPYVSCGKPVFSEKFPKDILKTY